MIGSSDETSLNSCSRLVKCFERIFRDLGVPLAKEKSVGPISG